MRVRARVAHLVRARARVAHLVRAGARVGVGVRVRVRIRVRVSVAMAHGVLVAVEDGGDTWRYREIQGRYTACWWQ